MNAISKDSWLPTGKAPYDVVQYDDFSKKPIDGTTVRTEKSRQWTDVTITSRLPRSVAPTPHLAKKGSTNKNLKRPEA